MQDSGPGLSDTVHLPRKKCLSGTCCPVAHVHRTHRCREDDTKPHEAPSRKIGKGCSRPIPVVVSNSKYLTSFFDRNGS